MKKQLYDRNEQRGSYCAEEGNENARKNDIKKMEKITMKESGVRTREEMGNSKSITLEQANKKAES